MNPITMNPNAVELIPDEALDPRVLQFIRDTPACLSLLYDLGILPEQLEPLSSPIGARDHWRLNAVVASMAGLVARQQALLVVCLKARDLFCDHATQTSAGYVRLPCGQAADVLQALETVLKP